MNNTFLLQTAHNRIQELEQKAINLFGNGVGAMNIDLNIKGARGGMAYYKENRISLNAILFKENFQSFVNQTVPHEYVHLLAYRLYGNDGIGHGQYWKFVMRRLGFVPDRCHNYDTSNARVRITKQFEYACSCQVHRVGLSVHKKIQFQNKTYTCKRCKQNISLK